MVGLSHSPQIVHQPKRPEEERKPRDGAHPTGIREGDGGPFGAIGQEGFQIGAEVPIVMF